MHLRKNVHSIVFEEPDNQVIPEFKIKLVWFNVLFLLNLHICCLYAIYLAFTSASWKTSLFAYAYGTMSILGITAGAHRLWSHRSYKAKLPLRILLCCFDSITAQGSIFKWSRDHRVHHKYSDTDADPHNINRGFFYAHIGAQMCRKHPDVARKGKTIYLDDLKSDPVVTFQKRFFIPMSIFFCYILPTIIPVWGWNENLWNSFHIAAMARYCYTTNLAGLVNSVGHTYGTRPYDKNIAATENALNSFLTNGDGWHNYHHAFPWDYASSELGNKWNPTKLFIDFMALIGQAYDLKTASPEYVKKRKLQTGDGTRRN